jgi:hypothetical protein
MTNKKSLAAVAKAFIAVILTAGIWCSSSAWAADWKPYAGDQYSSYFYDAKRVSYPYKTIYNVMDLELAKVDIVNVWTKRIIRSEKGREWRIREQKKQGLTTKGYERYEYTMSQKEMNCSGKKYRVLSEADYTKDGGVLSLFTKDYRLADWKSISPDSDTEALHRSLCEKSKEKASDRKDQQGEDL